MKAQVLERDTTSDNVDLELAYEILTEYLGMLSRGISDKRGKDAINKKKIAVLQEEREKAMNIRSSLTLEDSKLVNRILYLYSLAVRRSV